jgi:hypothetical protein
MRGLHHGAFQGGEDELRELVAVDVRRQAVGSLVEAALDGGGPGAEVDGQQLARGSARAAAIRER